MIEKNFRYVQPREIVQALWSAMIKEQHHKRRSLFLSIWLGPVLGSARYGAISDRGI
jgi:hypothetical protein